MTDPYPEDWLTAAQAAVLFGESTKVFKRVLEEQGTPVKHLHGGRIKVRRADVIALKSASIRPIDASAKE